MGSQQSGAGPHREQPSRWVQPKGHDPKAHAKHAGAFVCERCQVVQHGGRWYWGAPPVGEVSGGLCPACQRVHDRYPAGTLVLRGPGLAHADEIRRIAANQEQAEKSDHPLERLMDFEQRGDELVITTTGSHLARRVANALERRFHAKAKFHYAEEQDLLRVELDV